MLWSTGFKSSELGGHISERTNSGVYVYNNVTVSQAQLEFIDVNR